MGEPLYVDQHRVVWNDKAGALHFCQGAEIHSGIRLLWTACETQDIPANTAWQQRPEDAVTCAVCLAQEEGGR